MKMHRYYPPPWAARRSWRARSCLVWNAPLAPWRKIVVEWFSHFLARLVFVERYFLVAVAVAAASEVAAVVLHTPIQLTTVPYLFICFDTLPTSFQIWIPPMHVNTHITIWPATRLTRRIRILRNNRLDASRPCLPRHKAKIVCLPRPTPLLQTIEILKLHATT